MKIKLVKRIKSDKPIKFYDITTENTHNFSIGDSNIIVHNSSIAKAIARLARPFGASSILLDGYGFFGTEVSPQAAAARYTRVKLSKQTQELLNEYNHLTTRSPDESYDPLWLDIPLGLTTTIIGIAVGYKTIILPRKATDIKKFLEGKIDKIRPHFTGFSGSIKQHADLSNSWILSAKFKLINGNRLEVREMPPIIKYASLLKRLDNIFSEYDGNIRILNNSDQRCKIDIIYREKDINEWKCIQEKIKKIFSVVVKENLVFVKDEQVLVYESIEEYLKDYKWQLKRLDYKNTEWQKNFLFEELNFTIGKKAFIIFILQKKRTIEEVDIFLKPFTKNIKSRLESLTSKKFTKDALADTVLDIKEITSSLKKKERELKKSKNVFNKAKDPTLKRGISSQKSKKNLLENQLDQINGVDIWDGEDIDDVNMNLEQDE